MEDGKKMEKQQVVDLMTETIEDFNRIVARQQNVPQEQVEQLLKSVQSQVVMVNELLYDTLKDKGIIA